MKRIISLALLAIVIAASAVAYYRHANRERIFLDEAFVQLRGGGGLAVKMESGDSATVILEHSCCSGAGFDAVAVRTSDGQEFFARKNYCGVQGFFVELTEEGAKDIPHFTAFLRSEGYEVFPGAAP